jgi:hypothetical protein
MPLNTSFDTDRRRCGWGLKACPQPHLTSRTHKRTTLEGAYSRRVNIQHRMVYEVFKKERVVRVLRMWTHYE